MSSVRRIICLANSWKRKERCIAGIDTETGQWIRPVCDDRFPEDGRVPSQIRQIEGREPELLDILEIPLSQTCQAFKFERENLSILSGQWRKVGKATPADLFPYCDNSADILHNPLKFVKISELNSFPFHQRQTIQLVRTTQFSIEPRSASHGGVHWKGSFQTVRGQNLFDANITDPIFVQKLEYGHPLQNDYLLTISLSLPWKPPDWEDEAPCWKLIAGVIELSEDEVAIAEIDRQMQRVGWSIDRGRNYLRQNFQKRSRRQLTSEELQQFLQHLRVLPAGDDDIPY
ncbi:MAG: hypothetical protein WBC69_01795 [Geitlerinemataceae cyanobacterium]